MVTTISYFHINNSSIILPISYYDINDVKTAFLIQYPKVYDISQFEEDSYNYTALTEYIKLGISENKVLD